MRYTKRDCRFNIVKKYLLPKDVLDIHVCQNKLYKLW